MQYNALQYNIGVSFNTAIFSLGHSPTSS